MKSFLHYFNPGHETAVLFGSPYYTPSANVQRMTNELALLPLWYAAPDDFIWIEEEVQAATGIPAFLANLPEGLPPFPTVTGGKAGTVNGKGYPELTAAPWGLSPHSVHLFQQLKRKGAFSLTVPDWKPDFFRLTGRQTAAACLEKIREAEPELAFPVPPAFCRSMEDVDLYLRSEQPPFVLKTPYSSSGRGLLWLPDRKVTMQDRKWIDGAIRKQGCVSIERALDRVLDFAAEFYSDGAGQVDYQGLSVFGTEQKGNYSGNRLGTPESLKRLLTAWTGEEQLDRTLEIVRLAIEKIYGSLYRGYLGVDMLLYRRPGGSTGIHPCIEINMRYTMGMVALRLSENLLAPDREGNFFVTFDKAPGEAYQRHRSLQAAHPPEVRNGKIEKGYLSLCPVSEETKYRAYLLIP